VTMFLSVSVLAVLLCFINSTGGQSLSVGRCPLLPTVEKFDMTKYAGKWYESWKNQKYYRIVDAGLKCATETYTIMDDSTMKVSKNGVFSFGGKSFSQQGTARLINRSSGLGKLSFSYPALTFSPQNAPYWILDTDYTNYSVVWSCSNFRFLRLKIFWILTRDPNPDDAVIRKAFDVLSQNGISRRTLSKTNHKNCSQ